MSVEDGKDYPAYNANQTVGLINAGTKSSVSISAKIVNAGTIEMTNKNNGTVTNTRTITLSQDRKTLTDTVKNFDAQGKQTGTTTLVFERQ